jgi:hypothetical protein
MSVTSTKIKYNNGTQPLIMAWIGQDDPNRGDSKGSIGLAKLCAEMVGGRYVYVDEAMLDAQFSKAKSYKEKVEAALREIGQPDILIGTHSGDAYYVAEKRPTITVAHINETLSTKYGENRLVPHHLTSEILDNAGREFDAVYPQRRGPLVALMIGNDTPNIRDTVKKIHEIGKLYDEITFFVCPSLRAYRAPQLVFDYLDNNLESVFRSKSMRAYLSCLFQTGRDVFFAEYEQSITGYNPYLGLLARADHIVVSGHSYSLVSEALYTGKNIYTDWMCTEYTDLVDLGYVVPIETLDCALPFPTKSMPALDTTQKIADIIVDNFKNNKSMTL